MLLELFGLKMTLSLRRVQEVVVVVVMDLLLPIYQRRIKKYKIRCIVQTQVDMTVNYYRIGSPELVFGAIDCMGRMIVPNTVTTLTIC